MPRIWGGLLNTEPATCNGTCLTMGTVLEKREGGNLDAVRGRRGSVKGNL